MKRRWKIVLGAVVAIVLLSPIIDHFLIRSDFVWSFLWGHGMRQAQQRRVLLLCETDHQALLKAGREILTHELVKKKLRERQGIAGNFHIPTGVQIPEAIVDLRPKTVLLVLQRYKRFQ